jgi:hypothetical protein
MKVHRSTSPLRPGYVNCELALTITDYRVRLQPMRFFRLGKVGKATFLSMHLLTNHVAGLSGFTYRELRTKSKEGTAIYNQYFQQ